MFRKIADAFRNGLDEPTAPEMPYDDALRLARATKKTTPETLALLAHHSSVDVRSAVARNRMTPPEAFERLARDQDMAVLYSLTSNPSLPDELEIEVFKRGDRKVHLGLGDRTASAEVLKGLAASKDPIVQQKAAENPHAPTAVLLRLMDSPHEWCRYWAGEQLVARGVRATNPEAVEK